MSFAVDQIPLEHLHSSMNTSDMTVVTDECREPSEKESRVYGEKQKKKKNIFKKEPSLEVENTENIPNLAGGNKSKIWSAPKYDLGVRQEFGKIGVWEEENTPIGVVLPETVREYKKIAGILHKKRRSSIKKKKLHNQKLQEIIIYLSIFSLRFYPYHLD